MPSGYERLSSLDTSFLALETPDLHIQQVLRLVKDPGELPQCASLLVWGEKQGDLITADVILFHDEIN